MSERAFNFSAGPATLPESVLRQAQQDIWDLFGTGIGILEHSHRGKAFDRITAETEADCRKVGNIPDDYAVTWVQGGATTQCYFVPANFLPADRTADYFQTGKWANDSIKEVPLYGTCHICGSSKETNYDHIPVGDEVKYSANPVYVHFTANNTIMGTEFQAEPTPPKGAFLVCDSSSNMFSKPIDVKKYGLIYAGAQKNLGPSGIVLVIAKKSLIEEPVRELPQMMQYRNHANKEGRYNTPNTFGVYLMGLVFKWILERGGLNAVREMNADKAAVLYDFLDDQDFFLPHAKLDSRSMMNVTFKCPTPELDKLFIEQAAKKGLDGLKGHRSIGGMRASIYNAFPKKGCEALVSFMKAFAQEHAKAVSA
ncbi:MAG: 3-phosphoserine/phosphohydroxythreonine transaminase [Phycisphaeraceae bacterium]|nr:MAG: 3-phosphoserine/phosphohydroxythreonine transaminase [Phycisphaeraceae bacterium]